MPVCLSSSAIADFHDPTPARTSEHGLMHYLYGIRPVITSAPGEPVVIKYDLLPEHAFGAKRISSGFFKLPDAEHISAVLYSNCGTLNSTAAPLPPKSKLTHHRLYHPRRRLLISALRTSRSSKPK